MCPSRVPRNKSIILSVVNTRCLRLSASVRFAFFCEASSPVGFSRCQKTKVVQRKVRTLGPYSLGELTEGSKTASAPGPGHV